MLTLLVIYIIVFATIIIGGITILNKKSEKNNEKNETRHSRILAIILALHMVIMSLVCVFTSVCQHNRLVGNDEIYVYDVEISKGTNSETEFISHIFYDEDKDEFYAIKENLFTFWNMYEKVTIDKEFVINYIQKTITD